MPVKKVTKCICHERTFQEIKEYAKEQDFSTVQDLRDDRYCSCSCRMCGPYIEMVLETGIVAFEPGTYYRNKRSSQ